MKHTADQASPSLSPDASRRVIIGAILLVTLVGVSLSVSNPLLALEMERWGISSTVSGLTATLAGLGNVLAVPFVPFLAKRYGVKYVLATNLAIATLACIAFWLWQSLGAWFALRFVLGAAIGVLFVLSEFWINAAAPPHQRGRVMGLYATALYFGFAFGPALLGSVGTSGPAPYFTMAAILCLGLVPLATIGAATPQLDGAGKNSVMSFIRSAPTATFAAFVFGAIETGIVTQLPVHGLRLGFAERDATLLLTGFTLGNVLFQLPLGLLSDRVDRRKLLLSMALISAGFAASLLLAQSNFWLNWGILFALGGISGGIYTVGLAHLGSRFSGMDLVSANAAFVMLYSMGLMIGPPLIGLGMDLAGPTGLPVLTALGLMSYAMLVAARLKSR